MEWALVASVGIDAIIVLWWCDETLSEVVLPCDGCLIQGLGDHCVHIVFVITFRIHVPLLAGVDSLELMGGRSPTTCSG